MKPTGSRQHMVIPGGSGFLGMEIARFFEARNFDIYILTRGNRSSIGNIHFIQWDGKKMTGWETYLEAADAVINLAGKSVDCRYTNKNKSEILNSRIDSTRIIGKAIQECQQPPKYWLNAGSSTIYKDTHEQANTEESGVIGDTFSEEVCKAWENTFNQSVCPATKKILLRISIVLGRTGGAFIPLKRITQLGMGGHQGSGLQKISWIHINDLLNAIEWLMQQEKTGVYNMVSPHVVSNKAFMQKLREKLGVPFGISIPAWLLELGAAIVRTETELLLKSRYVSSKKLEREGFRFGFPELGLALNDLIR